MRKLRLALAAWLWPKDVRQGELFTIVRHLKDGVPCNDGSWVGATLRADAVEGDRIMFSELSEYSDQPVFRKVGYPAMPGKNCVVKPLAIPLLPNQRKELYEKAKQIQP